MPHQAAHSHTCSYYCKCHEQCSLSTQCHEPLHSWPIDMASTRNRARCDLEDVAQAVSGPPPSCCNTLVLARPQHHLRSLAKCHAKLFLVRSITQPLQTLCFTTTTRPDACYERMLANPLPCHNPVPCPLLTVHSVLSPEDAQCRATPDHLASACQQPAGGPHCMHSMHAMHPSISHGNSLDQLLRHKRFQRQ